MTTTEWTTEDELSLHWQLWGDGGKVSSVTPSGRQYIVMPNHEIGKWEVYLSADGSQFARLDDRTFHTRKQAMLWAEGSDE